VNNSIATFITHKVLKLMIQKEHKIKGATLLILGATFKENCPDTRNTKVMDIYKEFREFGVNVDLYDPWVCHGEMQKKYGVNMLKKINPEKSYSAIILAVAHNEFKSFNFEKYYKQGTVIFDTKAIIDRQWVDGRL
jgi:UDP-N-acetyl-D-galactosamine dehydrogenase